MFQSDAASQMLPPRSCLLVTTSFTVSTDFAHEEAVKPVWLLKQQQWVSRISFGPSWGVYHEEFVDVFNPSRIYTPNLLWERANQMLREETQTGNRLRPLQSCQWLDDDDPRGLAICLDFLWQTLSPAMRLFQCSLRAAVTRASHPT